MRFLAAIDLGAADHPWLVTRAGRLASIVGGRLDLLHVTRPEGETAISALRQLMALLEQVPAGVRGMPRVVGGKVIDVLAAESEHYETLVIGPREPGALERSVFGTIATRVSRRARCPVYVARGETLAADRAPKLLCGIDLTGGDPTWVTIEADKWALRFGGRVDLVFAVPEEADDDHRETWKVDLVRLLETIGEPSRGRGFLARGTPEDALIRLSGEYDLVLVGNREVGLEEKVMGSIAYRVIRNASCDVLVLPSTEQD